MSVRDNTDSSRGGGSSRGRGSYDSKLKGAIVPHPITPIQPVNLVNRYQVLGQIPKPYNTVLASKPPVVDPFANTSKPIKPFDRFVLLTYVEKQFLNILNVMRKTYFS